MRRDVFQAIADPTRRDIINILAKESLNLNALADRFSISRPAISKQIKILEECGIILLRQKGRERYCDANLQAFGQVRQWMEDCHQFWTARLDALELMLQEEQAVTRRQGASQRQQLKSRAKFPSSHHHKSKKS
ncbi:MAG TPA: metalloregulator ArsR/SmtB family transcription factor [Puia sp.]|nr:metalloregulator ArsR/SmtB family transcription factor [Puia sp.]